MFFTHSKAIQLRRQLEEFSVCIPASRTFIYDHFSFFSDGKSQVSCSEWVKLLLRNIFQLWEESLDSPSRDNSLESFSPSLSAWAMASLVFSFTSSKIPRANHRLAARLRTSFVSACREFKHKESEPKTEANSKVSRPPILRFKQGKHSAL